MVASATKTIILQVNLAEISSGFDELASLAILIAIIRFAIL
jgi:hypothetical protein